MPGIDLLVTSFELLRCAAGFAVAVEFVFEVLVDANWGAALMIRSLASMLMVNGPWKPVGMLNVNEIGAGRLLLLVVVTGGAIWVSVG